ncbi:NAD(P)H-binding protein [Enterococcus pallens]|uniref:NAD(P)-binding domain-containing protein n=1 Tax=Enterococcus pallens ATCC BAA-351 TaxID=1158607 RepID=R2SE54_9ENTE|nr:NAD(P)H-binding protein [Enterococcus pallens]EOH91156.1 hypothetical protein UAU_03695 [Enterococcus pallens ATCC BAA-351]EOU11476.1 hypothetical protein I588_05145 [Enterococcus pallens ATCC BAA-351]OJG78004.1 hypothetical protein RV10_GL002026 [Enterococcus pallens]
MTKILIIGATGSIGQVVREELLKRAGVELTLFSRTANQLNLINSKRETVISANVFDEEKLDNALKGQEIVFVALSGNLEKMTSAVIHSMKKFNVKRLIVISSMGIYNEIPDSIGASGNLAFNPFLQTYRNAADVVESSELDYTIIRPGWFDNGSDEYEITLKGEPFGGHNVSRKSIADLVLRLVDDPTVYLRKSIGINRPE